jgi:hypothetical protein
VAPAPRAPRLFPCGHRRADGTADGSHATNRSSVVPDAQAARGAGATTAAAQRRASAAPHHEPLVGRHLLAATHVWCKIGPIRGVCCMRLLAAVGIACRRLARAEVYDGLAGPPAGKRHAIWMQRVPEVLYGLAGSLAGKRRDVI